MNIKTYVVESQNKVITVINDEDGIKVRGESICHPEDTFNAEIGTNLSIAIAYKKYHEKKIKHLHSDIKDANDSIEKIIPVFTASLRKELDIKGMEKELKTHSLALEEKVEELNNLLAQV